LGPANWFIGWAVDGRDWLEGLVADAPREVRRFTVEDLHVTVAFLGQVGEERARAAFAIAEARRDEAFDVTLGGLVPMGSPRRPSALSLLLTEGHQEAARRMGAWREAMWAAAEARPDSRPPKPPVTVARPRRNARPDERRRAVAWAESKDPLGARVTLDRICLYTRAERTSAIPPASLFRIVAAHPPLARASS